MSRTLSAKKLTKLLNLALYKEYHHLSDSHISEILSGKYSPSRRDFIKHAGLSLVGTSALAMGCKTTAPGSSTSSQEKKLGKVVIVGGGVAGLTVAYRLANAGVTPTIYEGSERLGGRMYTKRNFNTEGMFCELGGELVDTGHTSLKTLVAELGLSIQNLELPTGIQSDLFYFGGSYRSEQEIIKAFQPLAAKIGSDQQLLIENGELIVPTYQAKISKNPKLQLLDRVSITQYLAQAECDQWLKDLIDVTYMGMMGAECEEQSVLNLLTLITADTREGFKFYGESDESQRIQGGNGSLPEALEKILLPRIPIHLNKRLVRISGSTLTFDEGGKTEDINADVIVLAVPFSTLRSVELRNVDLSPLKRQAIANWGYGKNSKFMMGFTARPWQNQPTLSSGSIYGDFKSQCFWDSSVGQNGKSGIIVNYLAGKSGEVIPPGQQLTALRDLEQVFPGSKNLFDGNKILQHWPTHPFTLGSYTCLKPGQYTTIYGAAGETEHRGTIFFAGEHCSVDYSGYMNGAIESGNKTAEALLRRA